MSNLQISVATFHVGRLELAQQSVGSNACIKLQAASLSGEECPAISWEEFQVCLKEFCTNFQTLCLQFLFFHILSTVIEKHY